MCGCGWVILMVGVEVPHRGPLVGQEPILLHLDYWTSWWSPCEVTCGRDRASWVEHWLLLGADALRLDEFFAIQDHQQPYGELYHQLP